MIEDYYMNRNTGQVMSSTQVGREIDYPDAWRLVGSIGDGRGGSPFGMLPANLCPTCGEPRIKGPGDSEFWVCPIGHGQLCHPAEWGGDRLSMVQEVYQPTPVMFSAADRKPVVVGPRVLIPCVVRAINPVNHGVVVLTDVWLPAESAIRWARPAGFKKYPATEILGGNKGAMRRVSIKFHETPTQVIVEGATMGVIEVHLPPQVRADWVPAP